MSHQAACCRVSVMVDILKLTRQACLSRPQIARHLGIKIDTAHRWVSELTAQGLLVERLGVRPPGDVGPAPMVYRLAAEWGGEAAE